MNWHNWITLHFFFLMKKQNKCHACDPTNDLSTWWVCLDWAYFYWNWKHCSEIIFKCVNSAVGRIFNKKVVEKCNLWDREQCTDALFTVDKVNYCGLNLKKRERKTQCRNIDARIIAIQTGTIANVRFYRVFTFYILIM